MPHRPLKNSMVKTWMELDLRQHLRLLRWPRWFALMLLGLWVALILGLVLRSPYVFEGSLTVREMGFTYVGDTERQFLQSINGVRQFSLTGQQPDGITLEGTFTSDDPLLSDRLGGLTALTLQLPYPDSQIYLEVLDPPEGGSDGLSILQLRFRPNTRVEALRYQAVGNSPAELSFCLELADQNEPSCLSSDPGLASGSAAPIGSLDFQFGQPLQITVGRTAIPELGLGADETEGGITFVYVPVDLQERSLLLASPSSIYLVPPAPPTAAEEADLGLQRWFWQDFPVADVAFTRSEGTYTVADEVGEASTVLTGEVRTGNKTMRLQDSQLLIIPPNDPGIGRLRFLQARSTSPAGLQTLVSGRARSLSVGFYRDFPVETISISRLGQFPQEAVNALLSFVAALTGFFLPKLFERP